jgi:serine/threonine protein kinase
MTASSLVARSAVLAGRYRVERVLGHGGMGIVVRATHRQLNQLVVVKFLRPVVVPPIAGGVIDLVLQACKALAIDLVHRDMACMTGAIPAAATAVRDAARPAGSAEPAP